MTTAKKRGRPPKPKLVAIVPIFRLSWVQSKMQYGITVHDHIEAQNLFANLRGRTEVGSGVLYYIHGGTYDLLEWF